MALKILSMAIAALVILSLGLWQSNFFVDKIDLNQKSDQVIPENAKEAFTVQETEVPENYVATGTIHSRDEVDISPRVIARVLSVNFREGDTVTRDQLLATLDNADLKSGLAASIKQREASEAAVKAAAEMIQAAQADFSTMEKNYERMKNLRASKAISQSQFDEAEGSFKKAKAGLAGAKMELVAAEARVGQANETIVQSQALLSYSDLRSPMDGVIFQRLADPGDLAVVGQPLLKIFDPDRLMLEANIRENLVSSVRTGMKATFAVEATGATYEGEVREISPFVNTSTRTFLVKVCLGSSPEVRPGMFGKLTLPIGSTKMILIPEKFITRIGQMETVIVKAPNGKFERRLVKCVPHSTGVLRLLSGLTPGDALADPTMLPKGGASK
jgi:multidrug efflux pump subunit AcrA (membrane-fusion protein)